MNINSSVLMRNLIVIVSVLLVLAIYYLIHIGNRFVEKGKEIKINRKKILPIILGVLTLYLFYLLAKQYNIITDTISTIIISAILAYLFNPIVNFLEKYDIPRGWGVIIVY